MNLFIPSFPLHEDFLSEKLGVLKSESFAWELFHGKVDDPERGKSVFCLINYAILDSQKISSC